MTVQASRVRVEQAEHAMPSRLRAWLRWFVRCEQEAAS